MSKYSPNSLMLIVNHSMTKGEASDVEEAKIRFDDVLLQSWLEHVPTRRTIPKRSKYYSERKTLLNKRAILPKLVAEQEPLND